LDELSQHRPHGSVSPDEGEIRLNREPSQWNKRIDKHDELPQKRRVEDSLVTLFKSELRAFGPKVCDIPSEEGGADDFEGCSIE
jgi:hypothetical protein